MQIPNIKDKIKNKKILATVCVGILVLVSGLWYYQNTISDTATNHLKKQEPYTVPALTKSYINSVYKFSLQMPEDFTVRELLKEGGMTLVFENNKAEGVQVEISSFDESALSVEKGIKIFDTNFIQKNIEDMKIIESQPVEIGSGYKGVAFKSDNEAFDGASREVWFVFRGNLYQISTYERFDELLQKMFVTWSFN